MSAKMLFLMLGMIVSVLCLGCRDVSASWQNEFSSRQQLCPVGYDPYGSVCLKMSKGFTSYANAESSCRESGGRLAAPKNAEVHSRIKQMAEETNTASYWIGLKKVQDVWTFSDGTPVGVDYVRWYAKQPIIGQGYDCGIMKKHYNHSWVSAECKWAWRYVCQYDLTGIDNSGVQSTTTTTTARTTTPRTTTAPPRYVKSGCEIGDLQRENLYTNARAYPSTYIVGTVLTADCKEGYVSRRIPVTIECTHANTWNIREPCLRTCPKPAIPNGVLTLNNTLSSTFLEGDEVVLTCPISLTLKGLVDGRLRCRANGTWSGGSMQDWACTARKVTDKDLDIRKDEGNKIDGNRDYDVRAGCPTAEHSSYIKSPVVVDNEFLKPGELMSLSCVHHSRIEPRSIQSGDIKKWTWMKEQHILETPIDRKFPHLKVDERGSLLILRMTKDLEGLYTCISTKDDDDDDDKDGDHSPVYFRSVYVALATNCSLVLDVKPQDTVVYDGSYFVLRCSAPNATVTWSKGDLPLIEDEDHRVLPNGALLITNARSADTGTYQCTAQHVKTRCQVSHSASLEVESSVEVMCGKPIMKKGKMLVEENRGKIVGGDEVERGSHPWLALINGDIPLTDGRAGRSSKVFCGGSLVNNYWVLTAAHCLRAIKHEKDVNHLKVILGKHDRTIIERDERVFRVERAVIHPHFDEDSFDNDVAMIRLTERVYYSNYIIPLCLPPKNFLAQFQPLHRTAAAGYVAGWGVLKEAGLQPSELRAVQLPLISDDLCKQSTSAVVTENMFCAGYNLTTGDACKGDSGGPFEMSVNGRTYLAGVVSWGEGCARPAKYGFYSKVENFVHEFVYKIWNE